MTKHSQAVSLVASLLEGEDPKEFFRQHTRQRISTSVSNSGKIYLDSNPDDAPGCYKITDAEGHDVLIQTDWDYPAVANTFGWNICYVQGDGDAECDHRCTDGTVDCPDCGVTASAFIEAARQFLDDNDGAEAEDPGYFMGEAEDPKDFFKRHLPAIARAAGQKRVGDYSLEDIGIEHQQFFQGRGTAYSGWDNVYVGTGDNPNEAIGDAIGQAIEDGWIMDVPAREADTWPETPSVGDEIHDQAREEAVREVNREDYENDEDYEAAVEEETEEAMEQGDWELSYFAAVYVREPQEGENALPRLEAEDPKAIFKQFASDPPNPSTWPKINRWQKYDRWGRANVQRRRAYYAATGSRYKRNPDGSMASENGFTVPETYEYQKQLPKTRFYRTVGHTPNRDDDFSHWIEHEDRDILQWDREGNVIVNDQGVASPSARQRMNLFLPHGWRLQTFRGRWYWFNDTWPENIRNRLHSDVIARRGTDFPWWIPYHRQDFIGPDGTLRWGQAFHRAMKKGFAKPDGTVKLELSQQPILAPRGVLHLHPHSNRRNAYDPNQMLMTLEGQYLRKLARWKRLKAKHERMNLVRKTERELEKVDEPGQKPDKGHARIR